MFDLVANALKEWKLRSTGDLVFVDKNGQPLGIEVIVRRGWWRSQIDAGVVTGTLPKYTGIHCARQFFHKLVFEPGFARRAGDVAAGSSRACRA